MSATAADLQGQPQEVDTTDKNLIWVKVHPKQGAKVGVWEVNDRHPKNPDLNDEREIYVAGQEQEPQQVARTAKVMTAIKDDAIMQVDAPTGGRKAKAKAAEADKPEGNVGTGAPPTGGNSAQTSNQTPGTGSTNPGNGEG